jgi:mono/diheme cytochrome c family protein
MLQRQRHSNSDLEMSGDLVGVPFGGVRYVSRHDLLRLPQQTFTVTRDENFSHPTQVSGVPLAVLAQSFAKSPAAGLVLAICTDRYCAPYPQAYLVAHKPIVVLQIDGKSPARWPKDADGSNMGPYLISNPNFTPSFEILSHLDEEQIPWGVVRLEFRDQREVLGAIAPRGPRAKDALVQDGYRIAQQNCFRCHNLGNAGGLKSGLTWNVLSTWASGSPEFFTAYVRDPKAKNAKAHMPGNPEYDSETLRALAAYFQTFSRPERKQ